MTDTMQDPPTANDELDDLREMVTDDEANHTDNLPQAIADAAQPDDDELDDLREIVTDDEANQTDNPPQALADDTDIADAATETSQSEDISKPQPITAAQTSQSNAQYNQPRRYVTTEKTLAIKMRDMLAALIANILGLLLDMVAIVWHIFVRLSPKVRMTLIGIIILLIMMPLSMNLRPVFAKSDVVPSSANVTGDSDGIAPFFSPTVQHWQTDIARWAESASIDPNTLAIIIQLQSCGNPSYMQGGLFGITQPDGTPYPDIEANAQAAIERLQLAFSIAENDFGRALVFYDVGEDMLDKDFGTWSSATIDFFIIGISLQQQALMGHTASPELSVWLQNAGMARCTQAQTALNN